MNKKKLRLEYLAKRNLLDISEKLELEDKIGVVSKGLPAELIQKLAKI
jgi:hypothetical protein